MDSTDPGVAAQLAPFIAWLAGRERDEPTRRSHRAHVEAYLQGTARPTVDPAEAERALQRYREYLQTCGRPQEPAHRQRVRTGIAGSSEAPKSSRSAGSRSDSA